MRLGDRLSQNMAAVKRLEANADLSALQTQTGSEYTSVGSVGHVPWGLGRLFGASKNLNSPAGHVTPTRSVRGIFNHLRVLESLCLCVSLSPSPQTSLPVVGSRRHGHHQNDQQQLRPRGDQSCRTTAGT